MEITIAKATELEKGKIYVITILKSAVDPVKVRNFGNALIRLGVAVLIYPVDNHNEIRIQGEKVYKQVEIGEVFNGEEEMAADARNKQEAAGDQDAEGASE